MQGPPPLAIRRRPPLGLSRVIDRLLDALAPRAPKACRWQQVGPPDAHGLRRWRCASCSAIVDASGRPMFCFTTSTT